MHEPWLLVEFRVTGNKCLPGRAARSQAPSKQNKRLETGYTDLEAIGAGGPGGGAAGPGFSANRAPCLRAQLPGNLCENTGSTW